NECLRQLDPPGPWLERDDGQQTSHGAVASQARQHRRVPRRSHRETRGIKIPQSLTQAARSAGLGFHPQVHQLMSYRVLTANGMPSLERPCPECNGRMKSTREVFFGSLGWRMAFHCPVEDHIVPLWAPEYESLIQALTRGVDPA